MRFSEIHGQDVATRVLQSSIRAQVPAHAYLFTGPKSVGKTSAALAFAASLNCDNPTPDGDSCGNCLSCIRIQAGTDLDVQMVQPEKNQTVVKQMGDMIANLVYAPVHGKRRVCIIEQADTLNTHAENSILKVLEEPPPYAVMILLSRNPTSLLQTIRSRCRLVRFHPAATSEVENLLRSKFSLPDDQVRVIAASSEGAIGRAISMALNPTMVEDRRTALETLDWWLQSPSIASLKAAETLRKIAEPSKSEKEEGQTTVRRLQELLDYIQSWYADMLQVRVLGENAALTNIDFADALRSQAGRYSTARLRAAIGSIMSTRRYLEGNITAQLALECMFFALTPN